MIYQLNKLASKTRTTDPSLTDQSQRDSTDINVMLKGATFGNLEYGKGAAPAPMAQDYSNLPGDYRDLIEFARQLPSYIGQLPPQLRDIPPDRLMQMTPAELTAIMKPPAPTPAPTEEPKP